MLRNNQLSRPTNYPNAIVGVNITLMLVELLKLRDLSIKKGVMTVVVIIIMMMMVVVVVVIHDDDDEGSSSSSSYDNNILYNHLCTNLYLLNL